MTTNNPQAKKNLAVNFSHLLHDTDSDLSKIFHVVDTVDTMTSRATSILHLLSGNFADANYRQDDETIYYTLMAAINEIKSINAVVNAYAKNLHAETSDIESALNSFAKRQA